MKTTLLTRRIEVLALLVLSPVAWGCTDNLWVLQTNSLPLGPVTVGTPLPVTLNATATRYNGGDGNGAVTGRVSATGSLTASGFTLNGFVAGSGLPFTFTGNITPTATGAQSANLIFTPFCGTFTFSPSTLPVNYTGQGGAAPPTSGLTLNSGSRGEPVSTSTGELFGHDDFADLSVSGPLPLTFRRYYGSFLSAAKITSALGANWMSNFDVSLAVSGTSATVTLFRGKTVAFKQSGSVWQLSSTEQRPYQLVAAGSGYQFLDPRTNLIDSFNSAGALTAIQDRNDNTLTLTRGANGPTQISDGLGRTLTLTYTGANLTKISDQAGRSVTYEYTGGALTAWTDANGKHSVYSYTTSGGVSALMTSETRPGGNQPLIQTYDAQGRVATQAHAVGATMTFTYPSAGGGAATAVPGGPNLTDTHDSNFNLTSSSDANGVASKFTYDSSNRILTSTNRTGATESLTYDSASGLPASHTNQAGSKTTFRYATTTAGGFTFYDRVGITFADGASVSWTVDSKGNITSRTDQAGNKWQFAYNAQGQRTTSTSPTGAITTANYGADATLTSVQLPSGDTITFTYDAAKRPVSIANPDGTTGTLRYDARGNLVGGTNENGATTAGSVDANNNLRTVTDALNAVVNLAYDADDRLIGVTDALGRITTRAYDAPGRLQSVTDASGASTSYVYDALNRATQVLDTAGKGLTLAYDQEARLTGLTDALSRTTTLTRDARGRVTGVKSPKSETASIAYDAVGRRISTTDPLGRATSYAWDPRSLPSSVKLPGGVASSYTYNELRRLTRQTDPNGNAWLASFDNQGRLISRTDPLGQATSLTYDSRHRVATVTLPQGSLKHTYDAAGNVTARAWSDGTSLNYAYDANNRLTAASGVSLSYDGNGRISASNGLQITRDPAGRIASVVYGSGKTVKYTYDNRGLLTQVADWVGGTTVFTYDAAHQLTSRAFPNGVTENYTYDADGRVASIQVAKGSAAISSIALTRDALGRVTSAARSAASVPDVPAGYFGQEVDAASQSLNAGYDSLGRVTKDALSGRTYAWDLASRLTSYGGTNGSASFTYDALGQRIARTDNAGTQNYVLNYALSLPSVATVQSGNADVRYYVWLPNGSLLEAVDASGSARHFYHFDEAGNANFLTGDAGTVTDSYAITPYGETIAQTGSTPNPFTFEGAFGVMQEGATGLYYMRARYYDSAAARFISRDPVIQRDPRSATPYQFAWANPVEYGDPTGLAPDKVSNTPAASDFSDDKVSSNTDPAATNSGYFELSVYFIDALFGDSAVKALIVPDINAEQLALVMQRNQNSAAALPPPPQLATGTGDLTNVNLDTINWNGGPPSTGFDWSLHGSDSGSVFGDPYAGLSDAISDVERTLDAQAAQDEEDVEEEVDEGGGGDSGAGAPDPDQPAVSAGGSYTHTSWPATALERPLTPITGPLAGKPPIITPGIGNAVHGSFTDASGLETDVNAIDYRTGAENSLGLPGLR